MPSARSNMFEPVLSQPSDAITIAAAVASSIIGSSRKISTRSMRIGRMQAVTPTIKPMFAMLEPTMLPKLMPPRSRQAARPFTANSGALVPNATTVRPMASCDTPRPRASPAAPLKRASPPTSSSVKPSSSRRRSAIIDRTGCRRRSCDVVAGTAQGT